MRHKHYPSYIYRAYYKGIALAVFATVVLSMVKQPPTVCAADQDLSLLLGGDMWFHPKFGGHGFAIVAYDRYQLPYKGHFGAEFNTDTLRISLDRFNLHQGLLETGIWLTGEAFLAGLLQDYYRNGIREPTLGFNASFVLGQAYLKLNLPGNHHVALIMAGRKWFFSSNDETYDRLVLPPDAWVFEPRITYTLWRIKGDASISDRHRLFWRVNGFAFGLELGTDLRDTTNRWGAFDSEVFDPVDPRNHPASIILIARQWLRIGHPITDWIRPQLIQTASFGEGEDDLTRVRLGGLNPYVVQIPGAPWAGFLSEKFIAAQLSVHIRVFGEVEVGPMASLVYLQDRDRSGSDNYSFVGGLGLFADLRWDIWQADLRGGWAPNLNRQSSEDGWALFGSIGCKL